MLLAGGYVVSEVLLTGGQKSSWTSTRTSAGLKVMTWKYGCRKGEKGCELYRKDHEDGSLRDCTAHALSSWAYELRQATAGYDATSDQVSRSLVWLWWLAPAAQ